MLAQTETALDVVLATASEPQDVAGDPRLRRLTPDAQRAELHGGALLQRALRDARAPYVLLLTAGDVLAPDAVARHVAALEEYPPAVVTAARARPRTSSAADADVGASGRTTTGEASTPAAPPDDASLGDDAVEHAACTKGALLANLLAGGTLRPGRLMLRRDAALAAGGFDATFAQHAADDLWLRLLPGAAVRPIDAVLLETSDDDARDACSAARSAADPAATLSTAMTPSLVERGRALVRAFLTHPTSDLVTALADGRWVAPAAARLQLASLLARSPVPDAMPLARCVALEALAHGASPPFPPELDALLEVAPEIAREGVPVLLQQSGRAPSLASSPPAHAPLGLADAPAAATFPPRMLLAIWHASRDRLGADRLLAEAETLRRAGVDLCLIAGANEAVDDAVPTSVRVEVLQQPTDADELPQLLARLGAAALLASTDDPVVAAATRAGAVVLAALPESSPRAYDLRRTVAVAAAEQARDARPALDAAFTARVVEQAGVAALRIAADGMRHPASATGDAYARRPWTEAQRRDLAQIARDAQALNVMASSARLRAKRVLDKLRLGHRIETGFRALRDRLRTVQAPRTVELPRSSAGAFLDAAATAPGWLWLVYATDPYSETRGQRSMWLTQELARRGHRIVYLYWRWYPSEAIPPSGNPNVLVVPIDQLPALQQHLLRLAQPARRVLLIEFPDVALWERLNLFNAHGWTTVYDCVDEWEEFGRIGQAGWYDRDVEEHLARDADVVVATHPLLADKLRAMSGRTVPLVPNGVDLRDLRAPEGGRRIDAAAPVIGYFGHLTSSWFDWELIAATAERHPEWRFEIYGYGQPETLALPPNVSVPGMLPHAEIAQRTARWSVGIVPFREGPLTRAVDPVKLYEYLALGMPVVAVGMPALASVPGVVVCDRDGFADALRTALTTPFEHERVAAYVESSRWEKRVDALLRLVEDAAATSNVVKALAG